MNNKQENLKLLTNEKNEKKKQNEKSKSQHKFLYEG